MNYTQSLSWLESTRRHGIKLGLTNVLRLFSLLDSPGRDLRFLHVAGTNGKGSVCAFLDNALRKQGLRTGLYTSPHLVSFRERIRVNAIPISEEETAAILTRIKSLCTDFEPTCFEIITALALVHFHQQDCEAVAWETGLGGRLDATNAVVPIVCGITPIGLDHQAWLGDNLQAIAREKAGIIKPGIPVVSSPQHPDAIAVIRETAARVGAPLTETESASPSRTLMMNGIHQQQNAEVASQMLRLSTLAPDITTTECALAETTWPGRFQRAGKHLVLDGAHNPDGAAALADTWRQQYGDRKAVLLFGAMGDKDVRSVWKTLLPIASEAVFVAGKGTRWIPPQELAGMLHGIPTQLAEGVAEGLRLVQEMQRPVLVTGSLFLVGETLSILQGTPQDWTDA